MKYTYKNIFAREYRGYRQIQQGLESVFHEIHGMRLTAWNCLPFDGIHYMEFGSISLLLWYQDKDHLKIQCSRTFLPEMKQDLPAFTKEKEYAGMELQDLYVLMGEEPMICLSFSDAFFNPNTEILHQFVLSSRKAGHGIQSLRVPDTTPFRRISTERIPTTQRFRKVVENKETKERFVSILDECGKERIPPLYNDVELTSTEREIYRISIRKEIPGGTDYDLFGICDSTGKELIPCIYPDLYYMANEYILVMDYRHKWWVLTEDNEAIFGPHPQGVDIYS
ncbi:MAG: WG repeat-containing protein, partial [Eubacteriales bacterium]|nr:WG repeat-containing protein [Eubacteriales bacterium]